MHRALTARGVNNVVVDSASIDTNRRARQAKSDRLDTAALLAKLGRYAAGERGVWSVVHVPSVEDEDRRPLHRELFTLTRERTRAINRLKALLALHGVVLETPRGLPGGDQSTYVNLWTGTALQAAVNLRVAAGYPIGGTSAGLAVLSPFVYAAFNVSSTSATVLANPYDASVTITNALFNVPVLQNLITDSHFVTRDRMGRLVTFLARLQQDGRSSAPRGIGVDEKSALGVLANGAVTVFGAGNGAYFLSVASSAIRVCSANTPLSYKPVTTVRVPVGSQFNLPSWTTANSTPYVLSAATGVLSSSTGAIY